MEIIIPHLNTDLDALGAAVGAKLLYPDAEIVLPGTPSPLAAEFISLHRYNLRVRTPGEVDLDGVTRVIVVDTADPARLGPLRSLAERAEVHLYDHHPPEAGDLEAAVAVRAPVGAACTLVAELLAEAGAVLTPLQATVMLLGIYADTQSLTVTGTTDRDARAAAFLLSQGASLPVVARFIGTGLVPAQQELLRQLQARSRWLHINGARVRLVEGETAAYIGGLAVVVHHLQQVLPAPALFAVVQMADRVHLVGRSQVPWVDSARVAAAFGGGGHPGAASAVVKGKPLAAVADLLITVLGQEVARPPMARDIMTAPVKAVLPEKPAEEAERIMLRYGHSGLPVVGPDSRLEGVVSLRDVAAARRHGLAHAPVKGIMHRQVVTVTPDLPLDEVQEIMVEKDIGRVPVVEAGNLVGIISRSDLLGQLYGTGVPHWHRTLYAKPETVGVLVPARAETDRTRQALAAAPAPVRWLLESVGRLSAECGVPAYAVGGFVRDLLLGRPNLDLDIVVEGDGPSFARLLAERLGGTVQAVERFGTAHVFLPEGGEGLPRRLDVATARREYYEHAAALPQVAHADLREDLFRRDFTMNALAIRLGPAEPQGLVDLYGGLQDLDQGQIRILHTLSFVEDPTRLLRAVRFAHRYGFRLEPETERCARAAVREGFLEKISQERFRNELQLILQERGSGTALQRAMELGLLRRLLPPDGTLDPETCGRLDRVESLADRLPDLCSTIRPWLTKVLLLCQSLPLTDGVKVVRQLKLRRDESQPVLHVLACARMALALVTAARPTPSEVVRVLEDWPPEGLAALALSGAEELVTRYWREWRGTRLAMTGDDLIAAGIPAGPRVGRLLARVKADRLDGRAPDRKTQLELALRYANEED
ncbi:MAG: CBS domain-containing protein [Mycobacterium leprae]